MKNYYNLFISVIITLTLISCTSSDNQNTSDGYANLALIASPSSSSGYRSAESMMVLNDGIIPESIENLREGAYIAWSRRSASPAWVQYEWVKPVSTREIGIHWLADGERVFLPKSFNLSYWDGNDYVPVNIISGSGMAANQMNKITIDEIETTRLRLEMENEERQVSGILEWEVLSSDNTKYTYRRN
ncbi:hypothetical protein ES705_31224 [subsurface metagenome]